MDTIVYAMCFGFLCGHADGYRYGEAVSNQTWARSAAECVRLPDQLIILSVLYSGVGNALFCVVTHFD